MIKKCLIFISTMVILTIFISSIIRYTYANLIKDDSNLTLTKISQFDIIDNVGSITLTSMTTLGEKNLSTQSKIDATIMYIICNKEKYNDYILNMNGKNYMKKDDFNKIMESIFECSLVSLNEYIDISIGNINYCYLSKYDTIKVEEKNTYFIVYTKYSRTLNDVKNYVYVRYQITNDMKIKDVNIIESIIV